MVEDGIERLGDRGCLNGIGKGTTDEEKECENGKTASEG